MDARRLEGEMTSWMLTAAALLATADAWRRLARTRELVAHAAHELRGPLTAAGLALEAVAGESRPPDRAEPSPGPEAKTSFPAPPDLLVALDAQLRRARL